MYRPPSHDDPNSLLAAESVRQSSPLQRTLVLGMIDAIGPVSAEDVQGAMQLAGNSVRPRIRELEQDGMIRKDGYGMTRSGRRCYVYVTTSKGAASLARALTLWGDE